MYILGQGTFIHRGTFSLVRRGFGAEGRPGWVGFFFVVK